MVKLKLLIITVLTISIAILVYRYNDYFSNNSPYNLIGQSSQSNLYTVISGGIHGSISDKRPLSAHTYNINLKSIIVKFTKNFYKYKDQEIIFEAGDVAGFGWLDRDTNSVGYECNFHNSAFHLADVKQKDEITNLFTTGDIKIKIYLQDNPLIFSGQIFEAPALITINNVTRGELIKLQYLFDNENININGSAYLNLNNYGIQMPALQNISEYKYDITIDFRAKATLLE